MAEQVARLGVPISALSPQAPEVYQVRRGDSLWAISALYLQRPWLWPELWGMNLSQIANPHLIFPGQKLYLERKDGYATLRTTATHDDAGAAQQTLRLSPRIRSESLFGPALPTLPLHLIEPFLAEPLVVDEAVLAQAARVVATRDSRVLASRGDRAYARGAGASALLMAEGQPRRLRVFRNAVALRDPVSREVLGYEAQYVGQVELVRGESSAVEGELAVPATIDILRSKEEIRIGDRLLPEPEHQIANYTPRAPAQAVDARVVSIYGSAVANAAQNQVVAINRGTRDGLASGDVLALLSGGASHVDRTDRARTTLQLPNERNGLLMVFRTFERVSYGLILEISTSVRVGDQLVNPSSTHLPSGVKVH